MYSLGDIVYFNGQTGVIAGYVNQTTYTVYFKTYKDQFRVVMDLKEDELLDYDNAEDDSDHVDDIA